MEQHIKDLFYYEHKTNNILKPIVLTETETKIFDIILRTLEKNKYTNVSLRVCGGWVRDKLLGYENDDIDICVVNIDPEGLCVLINTEIYPDKFKMRHSEKNSTKNKNVSVATMPIEGVSIDFVMIESNKIKGFNHNLDDTDILIDDVYRRDQTISALYYNLKTREIEDYTQKGLEDLKNGLIRMPKNPMEHFIYDPKCLIRDIRLAVKYQFKLDSAIEETVANDKERKIFDLFEKKTNKIKYGHDLMSMLGGNKPQCCIHIFYKFNLLETFLKPNNHTKHLEITPEQYKSILVHPVNLCGIAGYIIDSMVLTTNSFLGLNLKDKDAFKVFKQCVFNGLLSAFKTESFVVESTGIEIKDTQLVLNNLKISPEMQKQLCHLNKYGDEFRELIKKGNFKRGISGVIIRKINYYLLHPMILQCICLDYYDCIKDKTILISNLDQKLLTEVIKGYEDWISFLDKEDLHGVCMLKYLVTGDVIKREFQLDDKYVHIIKDFVMEKQIDLPNTTEEEMLLYIKEFLKTNPFY